jgi:hypothetical protein
MEKVFATNDSDDMVLAFLWLRAMSNIRAVGSVAVVALCDRRHAARSHINCR